MLILVRSCALGPSPYCLCSPALPGRMRVEEELGAGQRSSAVQQQAGGGGTGHLLARAKVRRRQRARQAGHRVYRCGRLFCVEHAQGVGRRPDWRASTSRSCWTTINPAPCKRQLQMRLEVNLDPTISILSSISERITSTYRSSLIEYSNLLSTPVVALLFFPCACPVAAAPTVRRSTGRGTVQRQAGEGRQPSLFHRSPKSEKDMEPGKPGTGFTDEEGMFVLSTYKELDGAHDRRAQRERSAG